jgi:hypothetical protein
MPTATEWCESLRDAIQEYTRTRRRTPAVRVTLTSDEQFYIYNATPAGSLVALAPYPDERGAEMIRPPGADEHDVRDYTPRVLLTDPSRVAKTELLYEAPARQAVGFGIRPDDA